MSAAAPRVAVAGVARTPFYRRGQSDPQSRVEMACGAILAALDDAGLSADDLEGFVHMSGGMDSALLAQVLGVPDVKFSVTLTGGGGASAGTLGVAAAAIQSGQARVVVVVRAMKQGVVHFGAAFAPGMKREVAPEADFYSTAGLISPGQMFALIARRHMHKYGVRREDFGAIAVAFRQHAQTRPDALRKTPLTLDDYLATPLLADPLCRHDFCLENDVALAVVLVAEDLAADRPHSPVWVAAAEHGGAGRWGQGEEWMGMPEEIFDTAGHRTIARRVYAKTGLGPKDIDVALIYDNFTSNVLLQLEDYGFADVGGGGELVSSGAISWPNGSIPVNTHGGQLSEGFSSGISHVIEGVEQLRGTAINQVAGAEVALVTGGAAAIPTSAAILTK
ncbi:MAG: thiolase [Ilumatobacteraceae bacterium]